MPRKQITIRMVDEGVEVEWSDEPEAPAVATDNPEAVERLTENEDRK